jgi:hypothetical protein
MKETRELFSAIFKKYDNTSCPTKTKTYFIDVRSREGGVVKKHLVFYSQISSTIPKELSLGEYVVFLADIEFRNVQFLNILELGGGSL